MITIIVIVILPISIYIITKFVMANTAGAQTAFTGQTMMAMDERLDQLLAHLDGHVLRSLRERERGEGRERVRCRWVEISKLMG